MINIELINIKLFVGSIGRGVEIDGETQVMLELWGMQSTPSSLSLPSSLWHGVVAIDRVLSTK